LKGLLPLKPQRAINPDKKERERERERKERGVQTKKKSGAV
jgi:hypothetical protein